MGRGKSYRARHYFYRPTRTGLLLRTPRWRVMRRRVRWANWNILTINQWTNLAENVRGRRHRGYVDGRAIRFAVKPAFPRRYVARGLIYHKCCDPPFRWRVVSTPATTVDERQTGQLAQDPQAIASSFERSFRRSHVVLSRIERGARWPLRWAGGRLIFRAASRRSGSGQATSADDYCISRDCARHLRSAWTKRRYTTLSPGERPCCRFASRP
jgi:hypothetical protein